MIEPTLLCNHVDLTGRRTEQVVLEEAQVGIPSSRTQACQEISRSPRMLSTLPLGNRACIGEILIYVLHALMRFDELVLN
jgi:hypothetical protein